VAPEGQDERGPRSARPLYGWFREGFDRADLQQARTLLEELEAR
jgi:hypothetical protein